MNEVRNIVAIAKKEFMDNWRNKWIIAIAAIFLILMLVISYFGTRGGEAGWRDITATIAGMSIFVVLLIPIISLMLGYATVVGEKEKGSLGVLLSYPVSRNEVIIGKFVGLALVVITTVLIGFGIAGMVIGINVGHLDGKSYGLFILSTILFGLAYLAIAILISTIFEKRSTAMGAVIFLWFFFAIIWGIIILGILMLSGWHMLETHNVGYIDVYGGNSSIELSQNAYSIAYGNGNIYALCKDSIIEYNISTKQKHRITNIAKNSTRISYGGRRLYISGDKLWIYNIDGNNWNEIDGSCNDVAYGDGILFILNYMEMKEYNMSSGKTINISLPSICYSIAYGGNHVYLSSGKIIYQYNPENGTWKQFTNFSIEKIYSIEYGDGDIFILGNPSYVLNISTGKFAELPIFGIDIAYGDGKLFVLKNEKTYSVERPPDWYYITDFFNPVQTYNGIMRLITNTTMSNMFKETYPSFYNTYSLEATLLLWILAPLIASIYMFRRKDI